MAELGLDDEFVEQAVVGRTAYGCLLYHTPHDALAGLMGKDALDVYTEVGHYPGEWVDTDDNVWHRLSGEAWMNRSFASTDFPTSPLRVVHREEFVFGWFGPDDPYDYVTAFAMADAAGNTTGWYCEEEIDGQV